jgi:hypothetical protein
MASFSQRHGLKPMQKALQVEAVDLDLRNALWTAFDTVYCRTSSPTREQLNQLLTRFWLHYFKQPSDTRPVQDKLINELRSRFFGGMWYDVFDILEFIANECSHKTTEFVTKCNSAMERENSGYRFIQTQITSIISNDEIEAVETALECAVSGARVHLSTALAMLSDRTSPDYRNSIKESISAVESVCRVIAGQGTTLADALKSLRDKLKLHGALEKAFSSLYGWTSDANGIRHALMDEPNLSFSDAKFMLVACAGFINYLLGKAAELGIEIPKA